MQSILTKYIPATNMRGSRIKAYTSGKAGSLTLPYDHALNANANHMHAAYELAKKLGWRGQFIEGDLGDKVGGNVYVILTDASFTL